MELVAAGFHGGSGDRGPGRVRSHRVDQRQNRILHLRDVNRSAVQHAVATAPKLPHRLDAGPAQAQLARDRRGEAAHHRRGDVPGELRKADRLDETDAQAAGEIFGKPPHRQRGKDRAAHQAALRLGDQAERARAPARIVADAEKQDRALLRQPAAAEQHGLGGTPAQAHQERRDRVSLGDPRRVLSHRNAIGGIEEISERQSNRRPACIRTDPVYRASQEGDRAAVVELDEQIRGSERHRHELVALTLVTRRRRHGYAAHLDSKHGRAPAPDSGGRHAAETRRQALTNREP